MKKICIILFSCCCLSVQAQTKKQPNVVIIYADDVGYGDLSCNGATKIKTPNLDRIAARGIRFTNAYATSSTCTPSRYALLTGEYPWRKKGTGIAAGDAGAIIPDQQTTLADVFKNAGYHTGVIGKWHLGLGGQTGPDWNGEIQSTPNDLGFDFSFIIPATPDRVPCVYVENRRVHKLDPADPIQVSYKQPVPGLPTGKEHPELLTMKYSHGHDQTIINGISRIGYMNGGRAAWWNDALMGDEITSRSLSFIRENKKRPFFLYFAIHDIHVPRVPHPRYVNKSGMGARGDALLELDDNAGKILNLLDSLKLTDNTMVIFSSDNGPVLDDGYVDEAVEKLNGHTPGGGFRGGKYSRFDAGTHLPFLVSWPACIAKGKTSDALISQVDLIASFAAFTKQALPAGTAPDSENILDAMLGKSAKGRTSLIVQGLGEGLGIIQDEWKYIAPSAGVPLLKDTNIETGSSKTPQLYHLRTDKGERNNLAAANPEKVQELSSLLNRIIEQKK
jgi:arylsulfatase A-like enzyme